MNGIFRDPLKQANTCQYAPGATRAWGDCKGTGLHLHRSCAEEGSADWRYQRPTDRRTNRITGISPTTNNANAGKAARSHSPSDVNP